MRALRIRAAIGAWALMAAACCLPADAERLLIPMDLTQTDHLRAYEAARRDRTAAIQRGSLANEWLKEGGNADWVYGYHAWTAPLGEPAPV